MDTMPPVSRSNATLPGIGGADDAIGGYVSTKGVSFASGPNAPIFVILKLDTDGSVNSTLNHEAGQP